MTLAPAPSLADVLEKELTAQVVQLARTLGWIRYHSWTSKHSPSGFPDEVLVRDRVVYLELKREKTSPTAEQIKWLRALIAAGAETYLIRPRNLQALAAILAARRDPLGGHLTSEAGRIAQAELDAELRKTLG